MKEKFELPNQPSELLELALTDLIACEDMPRKYRISMGTWFSRQNSVSSVCTVCLAGAVMARHLDQLEVADGGEINEDTFVYPGVLPSNFEDSICLKLIALDYFRLGAIAQGLTTLGRAPEAMSWALFPVPDYSTSPTKFKEAMWEMILQLKENGL